MTIDFSDLLKVKITRKTNLEDKINVFQQFINQNLLSIEGSVDIATEILLKTTTIKKKLTQRKLAPRTYLEAIQEEAISIGQKTPLYKNAVYDERISNQQNDAKQIIVGIIERCNQIATHFAQLYYDYYFEIQLDLFKIAPKQLQLNKTIKDYLALYWAYITPPYHLKFEDAKTKVLIDMIEYEKINNLGGIVLEQDFNKRKIIEQEIKKINKFYNENFAINIPK